MWITRKEYEELKDTLNETVELTETLKFKVESLELRLETFEKIPHEQASPEHFKTKEGLYNYKQRKPKAGNQEEEE